MDIESEEERECCMAPFDFKRLRRAPRSHKMAQVCGCAPRPSDVAPKRGRGVGPTRRVRRRGVPGGPGRTRR
eukprot:6897908-Alexandrium_andersonii.AAC.1